MKKLRAWIESSNSLCLDLRSKLEFKSRHLKSSTNIPLYQLSLRQAELPPKHLPFAVIEPLHAKGCSSWLTERGWQIPYVVWEGQFAWKDVLANQWTSTTNKQWLLFQPSPFLKNHIDMIENTLPKRASWQCLDVGCGAGRDVGWLLSRGGKWRASAFDALPGAMIRTDMLVRNLKVTNHMDILAQAKVMSNGEWKLISNAWWKNQNVEINDALDEISRRLAMSELEECKDSPAVPFPEFYKNLIPTQQQQKFDLILNIRFLSRPFLLDVPELLNVGGYFIMSHFVHDDVHEYKHPKRSLRLELNEISNLYKDMSHIEVIKDVIEESEDGRPINSIIVRRIS